MKNCHNCHNKTHEFLLFKYDTQNNYCQDCLKGLTPREKRLLQQQKYDKNHTIAETLHEFNKTFQPKCQSNQ